MSGLEVRLEDNALWLRLNRPDHYNALNGELLVGLVTELRAAGTRDDVRVVVVTGAGAAFSAGADLEGDRPQDAYDASSVQAASELVRTVTGLGKPVVCGLNGIAAGVGMSLALACDLVVADDTAGLTLAFSRIGLMPDGGATSTVAASVGRARAMRLALTSDLLTATEAYDAGLVTHVFAHDAYEDELRRVVRRLAAGPPLAFAATKRAINGATLTGLEDAFDRELADQPRLLRTEDVTEGMRAFLDKRRPTFRGR
ncbi:MAG: enoyl-CoA hydratase-related protein [Marmoricola sp.]